MWNLHVIKAVRKNFCSKQLGKCPPSLTFALIVLFMTLLTSCDQQEISEETAPKQEPISKTIDRGPISVKLDLDRNSITIAERLNLTLQVTVKEDYEVELPRFGAKLEQFGIIDYHTSEPELLNNQKKRLSRSYVLEPFLSGEYKIPPMTVKFWKPEETEDLHEIETEEITITVSSLLPDDVRDLRIHDITGTVDLPRNTRAWVTGAGIIACILSCVIGGTVLWRRRSAPNIIVPKVPPHEIAFGELEALVADDLPTKGEIKRFYQRLSEILRRYIENRFGLHAPEQTTDEFLIGLRSNEKLNREYRSLLETFLRHCDLVKFAEYQPPNEEIQKTFDSCKTFIMETQPQEEEK